MMIQIDTNAQGRLIQSIKTALRTPHYEGTEVFGEYYTVEALISILLRYLRERITTDEDPRRFGAPLRRELANRWKFRVGSYRLICDIKDKKSLVLILLIGHRSKIYSNRNR